MEFVAQEGEHNQTLQVTLLYMKVADYKYALKQTSNSKIDFRHDLVRNKYSKWIFGQHNEIKMGGHSI